MTYRFLDHLQKLDDELAVELKAELDKTAAELKAAEPAEAKEASLFDRLDRPTPSEEVASMKAAAEARAETVMREAAVGAALDDMMLDKQASIDAVMHAGARLRG